MRPQQAAVSGVGRMASEVRVVHLRNMLVFVLLLCSGATAMPAALTGPGQTAQQPAAHPGETLGRSCGDDDRPGTNATVRFAVVGATSSLESGSHLKPARGNTPVHALASRGAGIRNAVPCVVPVVAAQVADSTVNRNRNGQEQPVRMHRGEIDRGFVLPGSVVVLIAGVLGVVLVSRRPVPAARGNTKG